MENTRNSRRGFFFTAMALAILSFMLLTSQVWVRTFEQQDASAVIRFKGEAMRLVLSTLSSKAMSDFANASAFYATYKLVNATETSALDQLHRLVWAMPQKIATLTSPAMAAHHRSLPGFPCGLGSSVSESMTPKIMVTQTAPT